MTKKVLVETSGDTSFLPGRMVDRLIFDHENERVVADGGEPATCEEIILGITKASLATESFLSAASFQETTKVLTDAALEGKVDELRGLKENVIIGKLIPAATGLRSYRNIELATAGIPAEMDVFGDMMAHTRRRRPRPLPRAAVGAADRQCVAEQRGILMLVDDLDLPTYVHSVLSRAGIETRERSACSTRASSSWPCRVSARRAWRRYGSSLAEKGWALAGEAGAEVADEDGEVLLGMGDPSR